MWLRSATCATVSCDTSQSINSAKALYSVPGASSLARKSVSQLELPDLERAPSLGFRKFRHLGPIKLYFYCGRIRLPEKLHGFLGQPHAFHTRPWVVARACAYCFGNRDCVDGSCRDPAWCG